MGRRDDPRRRARCATDSRHAAHLRDRTTRARSWPPSPTRDVQHVLLEGGPTLAAAFLRAGLVDAVALVPRARAPGRRRGRAGRPRASSTIVARRCDLADHRRRASSAADVRIDCPGAPGRHRGGLSVFTGIVEELGTRRRGPRPARRLGAAAHPRRRSSPPTPRTATSSRSTASASRSSTTATATFTRRRDGRDPAPQRRSGALAAGSPVNLERPMTARRPARRAHRAGPRRRHRRRSSRARPASTGRSSRLAARRPRPLRRREGLDHRRRRLADRRRRRDRDWFSVSLIPTTLGPPRSGTRPVGDPVNLEVDVIAKYVERMLRAGGPS